MILGAIDINKIVLEKMEPPMVHQNEQAYNYIISGIGGILWLISLIISITIIVYYKKYKPFILTMIVSLIMILKTTIMDLLEINGYYSINIVQFIILIIQLISFIYSTVKLIKHIKSDKFRKEK